MAKTPPAGDVFPVIMAGGSGTRFWPLSRKKKPKQFLPLSTLRPLITETAARLSGLAPLSQTFVVCGAVHAGPTRRLIRGLPAKNVLVEPEARNTAPAIALATAHVAAANPRGVMVVLPSDQHVADVPGFHAAVGEAIRVAREGFIVTLGITPTRPETGYGYIKRGAPLSGAAQRVAAFVEKPNLETARTYLSGGAHLWNAGIFVFRADVMLEAFKTLMPDLASALDVYRAALGTKKAASVLKKSFAQMPATSIDYGIAEKSPHMAVVPGSFGWSDVGSFNALPEVRSADANGNVVEGELSFVIDSKGCVVMGQNKPIAVVGMTDVVVVDAGDAMLVLPKDKSQDVKKVVDALKARGLSRYL